MLGALALAVFILLLVAYVTGLPFRVGDGYEEERSESKVRDVEYTEKKPGATPDEEAKRERIEYTER